MLLSREFLVALNPRAHFSFIQSKARRLYIVELYRIYKVRPRTPYRTDGITVRQKRLLENWRCSMQADVVVVVVVGEVASTLLVTSVILTI